jgi:hypothetical protein
MEWFWLTLGTILTIAGLVGCILPLIPGPPLSYAALLIAHFTLDEPFTTRFLMVWLILVILVTLLDYYVPIWGTQKFGGSKSGVWGSAVGLIVGLFFFPPLGIVVGPFIGAVAGELLIGKDMQIALKSGLGSFLGFITGTIMKLAVSLFLGFHFFKAVI